MIVVFVSCKETAGAWWWVQNYWARDDLLILGTTNTANLRRWVISEPPEGS